MNTLVLRLGRNRWLHKLAAQLHVVPIADLVLSRLPLQRRLQPSGLAYRVTSVDQLSLESGLFMREEYAPALTGRGVATFIDLGCNVGWFALWLTARNPNSPCRGLLIDAHPRMVAEAIWHMERNSLQGCIVVHGAVGVSPSQSSTIFHLHPSSSASSVLPYSHGKQLPVKGKITRVRVPAVSVASEWQDRFGDAVVDLLKVDIEGKELDLVVNESAFLQQRVRRVVIEWHKWCVSLTQLDAHLTAIGFAPRGVFDETDLVGLAIYENAHEVG